MSLNWSNSLPSPKPLLGFLGALRRFGGKPAFSLRAQIIVLIVALVGPTIGFSVFVMLRLAQAERQFDQSHSLSNARAISSAVDKQLQTAQATLAVLATAPELQHRDLAAFYEQCERVARQNDARILLADRDGHQLFNTVRPFGTKLPDLRGMALLREVVASQSPHVSNLVRGVATDDSQVVVYVPVVEDGATPLVLLMGFRPEALSGIFADQQFPEAWTIALIDRNGSVVGRNRALGRVLGQPVTPDLKAAMDASAEGLATLYNQEGVEVGTAFTRSAYSGWTVAVGIPRSLTEAPLQRSLIEIGAGGLLILGFCAAVALWITRRIGRSTEALAAATLALGREERLPHAASRVREINTVLTAIRTASDALRRRSEERDQAELALRKSEAHLQQAQQLGSTGSFERNFGSPFSLWSAETYRILGLDPATFVPNRVNYFAMIHEDDRPAVIAASNDISPESARRSIEYRIFRPSGEIRIVRRRASPILDESGAVSGVIGTIQDVTEMRKAEEERRQLEKRLGQTQRMEALGTLAGGIAHDLNNTMVPVIALSKGLLKRFPADGTALSQLTLIHQAGCRARDLVKQILAFSRKENQRKRRVDFAAFVGETLQMIRATAPSTIDIRYTAPDGLPPIVGDPSQLHQVLINLVTNAVQAIGNRTGTVAISLTAVELDRAIDGSESPVVPALGLAVRDTGCGMDKATLDRIFDPFFTTKEVGEGTGLGLSVSHGIVVSHGGRIEVRSELGQGTEFVILLPAAPAQSDPDATGAE